MNLNELAECQTGLVLSRKKIERRLSKKLHIYRIFTLSAFTQNGLERNQLGLFEAKEDIGDKYLSKIGDVIVRLSSPNYAISVDSESAGILIPSQFLRIRITNDRLNPAYLAIYLNSNEAMRQIERLSIGSVIRVLTVAKFLEIQIPEPPLIEQEKIVRLHKIINRQNTIKKKLSEAEEQRNQYYINKLFKE